MVVAIYPLHLEAGIKRIVVSTYQAVSGWGKEAVEQMKEETRKIVAAGFSLRGAPVKNRVLPHQIAFNLFPHIDKFEENGYTREEMKMVNETRKIMDEPQMPVTATCVRVPIFTGHSEAVNLELEEKLTSAEALKILRKAPGVVVIDDPASSGYPLPINAAGTDPVYVGRVREDRSVSRGLNLWVVSDNLRKGAALNAVQIAELLIKRK
jgi:aspartate-semialdehyde dehydrogenase